MRIDSPPIRSQLPVCTAWGLAEAPQPAHIAVALPGLGGILEKVSRLEGRTGGPRGTREARFSRLQAEPHHSFGRSEKKVAVAGVGQPPTTRARMDPSQQVVRPAQKRSPLLTR